MRVSLFVVFLAVFLFTAGVALYVFLQQAGVFGQPEVEEAPYLGTLLAAVIVEVAGGVMALWFDLFGLRGNKRESARHEVQKVRLHFEDMLDIRGLEGCYAVCLLINSHTAPTDDSDTFDEEEMRARIMVPEDEGPYMNLKIPPDRDHILVSVEYDGIEYSGSFSVDSRVLPLRAKEYE